MEAIFFLKNLGFVPGLPLCQTRTIWYDDYLRIRHELNTKWYDAVRCNKMQHDGDTMQYVAVWWWWRINTIAQWCDENTIGANGNLHEPMRTCAIQYDNVIFAHRIGMHWVAADTRRISVQMYNESIRMYSDEIRTNRNWHELMRRSAMQYDTIWIGFDSQGQYECFEHFKTIVLSCELIRKWQRTNNKVIQINTVLCDVQRMPIRIGSQTKFATVGRGHYQVLNCVLIVPIMLWCFMPMESTMDESKPNCFCFLLHGMLPVWKLL